MKKSLQWVFVMLWFVLASGLVFAVNNTTSKAFDHDNRLSIQLMSMDFEHDFVAALRSAHPMQGNRIVHIRTSDGCFCQTLVQSHVEKINQLVASL